MVLQIYLWQDTQYKYRWFYLNWGLYLQSLITISTNELISQYVLNCHHSRHIKGIVSKARNWQIGYMTLVTRQSAAASRWQVTPPLPLATPLRTRRLPHLDRSRLPVSEFIVTLVLILLQFYWFSYALFLFYTLLAVNVMLRFVDFYRCIIKIL